MLVSASPVSVTRFVAQPFHSSIRMIWVLMPNPMASTKHATCIPEEAQGNTNFFKLVGRVGIEHTTNRLKAGCSTTELTARDDYGKPARHSKGSRGRRMIPQMTARFRRPGPRGAAV